MIPDRYNVDNLKRAMHDPSMFLNEINRQIKYASYFLFESLRKYKFTYEYGRGIDVMAEDWDNLIILDACRFDVFQEYNTIDGNLDSKVSKASKTPEFVEKNFANRELHDTVYVSENPHAEDLDDDVFYTIVKLYNDTQIKNAEADSHNVARHGSGQQQVRESAIEASNKYPNKRLLVHFMPPHFPALGPKADRVRERLGREHGLEFTQINRLRNQNVGDKTNGVTRINHLAAAADQEYTSFEEARECYAENLELALEEVEKLLEELNGKTVVTSDHGELLGDKKIYRPRPTRIGHHKRVYVPELRVVPWLVLDSQTRRDIVSEEPIGSKSVPDDVVDERLRTLGYLE